MLARFRESLGSDVEVELTDPETPEEERAVESA